MNNTDTINTIDFVMFDPVEAKEPWAMDDDPDYLVVETLIDGRKLLDIIYEEEERFPEARDLNRDRDSYGHILPEELHWELAHALYDPGSFTYDFGAFLFCCGSCGFTDCWTVAVKIEQDEEYVYWRRFRHFHRDWPYELSFKFRRADYEKAMLKLKEMSENQKRTRKKR